MTKMRSAQQYLTISLGTLIFTIGNIFFITPAGLYSGGFLGVSQVIRTLLKTYTDILPENVDIAGIINFCFNVPLLLLAYKYISKKFLIRTIYSIILQTIFFTIIPEQSGLILTDTLSNSIVGGLVSGTGVGLILLSSGSSGGTDIIAFYLAMRMKNFSVGKFALIFNIVLYAVAAKIWGVPTAIYSVIQTAVFSTTADRLHIQNITLTVIVFTKSKEIPGAVASELTRGVTVWEGKGAYTGNDKTIFITVISKRERNMVKGIILKRDPDAFIIFSEGSAVTGNFEKRL